MVVLIVVVDDSVVVVGASVVVVVGAFVVVVVGALVDVVVAGALVVGADEVTDAPWPTDPAWSFTGSPLHPVSMMMRVTAPTRRASVVGSVTQPPVTNFPILR